MMGLSPLQRDLRENDIRFRDYRKDSVFGPSTSLPADASGYTAQVAGTSPSLDIMKSNIAASLAKGHTLTSYHTIQDDIRNAGAKWVDKEVVTDHNWVSSRQPDDIPAFNSAMLELFAHSRQKAAAGAR